MMKVNVAWLHESSTQIFHLANRIDRVLEQMVEIRNKLYDSWDMGGQLPEAFLKTYWKIGKQYEALQALGRALYSAAEQYEHCERRNLMDWQARIADYLRRNDFSKFRIGVLLIPEWQKRIFSYPIRWERICARQKISTEECAEMFEKLELNRIIRIGDQQD